jgi:hypothetical protein
MTVPPSPARLTPIPRLGEWILIALLDLRTRESDSNSRDVLARIGHLFDDLMTPADRQPDLDLPGALVWQARVLMARQYLAADDLVQYDGGHWQLTEAGQHAAVDFLRTVMRGPRPRRRTRRASTPRPRRPIRRFEELPPAAYPAVKPANSGIDQEFSQRSDVPLSIVIELNPDHDGGLTAAYRAFIQMWEARGFGRVPNLSADCVYATMSISALRSFIGQDRRRPEAERVLHRVWPDVPLVPPVTGDSGHFITRIPAPR